MEDFVEKYLVHDSSSIVDKRMAEIEITRLIERVELGGPVLDMGYGHGVVANAIVAKFGHCSVVEKSSDLVSEAQKVFGEKLDIVQSTFENYSPTRKFNTVLATAVLHHVEDPRAVLQRIRSWMVPGGTLLVSTPNAQSIHRMLAVALGLERAVEEISPTGMEMGVIRTFTPAQLKELIQRAGFSIVDQHPSFVKFLPYSNMADYTIPQLRSLFDIALLAPTDFHATIVFEAKLESDA